MGSLLYSLLSKIKSSPVTHLLLVITFLGSGLIVNFAQLILYFGVRPFSKYYFRKLNYYVAYSLYCQLLFVAEWWGNTDLIIYINKDDFEKYYGKEHGYLCMNHRYEIDWLMGLLFCDRIHMLANCKTFAKKSIQYVPTMGWAFKFGECVFLDRNWEKDKETIGRQLRELVEYPDPIWLLLTAEGTRFTPEKHVNSLKFAREKGLPELQHHLTPRTKGFTASIPYLKGKFGAIYDVQFAFKKSETATINNFLQGKSVEAHLYIDRIPVEEVPSKEEESAAWLHQLYQKKDRMMDSFFNTGDYFAQSGVPRVEPFRLPRRYCSLLNTLTWAVVVLVPICYGLLKLLTSGSTVYVMIGIAIIAIFFLVLYKMIGITKISHSSSYGKDKSSKEDAKKTE